MSGKHNAVRQKEFRASRKEAAYKKLGNKCSNPACQWLNPDGSRGCTDQRCLQVDHVQGDGHIERKENKGGDTAALYGRVLKDTDNRYQLLCANCNWIKRVLNKE
jgi:hypothetical protein